MNLNDLKNESLFIYKNEVYYGLNPSDIKKLPTTQKNKETLATFFKVRPIDLHTINAISNIIKSIKINKKKFPNHKNEIEEFYGSIIDDYLAFIIDTNCVIDKCKEFEPKRSNDCEIQRQA